MLATIVGYRPDAALSIKDGRIFDGLRALQATAIAPGAFSAASASAQPFPEPSGISSGKRVNALGDYLVRSQSPDSLESHSVEQVAVLLCPISRPFRAR